MSKGLEAITSPVSTELRNDKQFYTYTKEDVETIEKELKALEIIKNKRVNVDLIYYAKNIDDYNRNIGTYLTIDRKITEEEYVLLKEVLL